MLGVTEEAGAEFFSMRSGDMTVMVNSTMTTKKTIAVAQLIPQYRESEGFGRRRLLTPDEILRFPNDECLIILRGQNVLRAKKFDYTGHPYAKNAVSASIFNYKVEPCLPQEEIADTDENEGSEKPKVNLDNMDSAPRTDKKKHARHSKQLPAKKAKLIAGKERSPQILTLVQPDPETEETSADMSATPPASDNDMEEETITPAAPKKEASVETTPGSLYGTAQPPKDF